MARAVRARYSDAHDIIMSGVDHGDSWTEEPFPEEDLAPSAGGWTAPAGQRQARSETDVRGPSDRYSCHAHDHVRDVEEAAHDEPEGFITCPRRVPRCIALADGTPRISCTRSAMPSEVTYHWRGAFTNDEIHALHAEAFETRLYSESEWNWVDQTQRYSLGWIITRQGDRFVGFANVLWDGLVHAYLEDVMVAGDLRHHHIGVALVHTARDAARTAGCEFLHVNFEAGLRSFYIDACGFTPVQGGLMELT